MSQTSPEAIAGIIGAASILTSWIGSAFIAGYRWGSVKVRLDMVEASMQNMATKEQLSGVKEDMAEIKGMFRMTLKDSSDG